jgi:hypothetical protein
MITQIKGFLMAIEIFGFKNRAYLVFKNMNAVLQLYSNGSCLFESPSVPAGKEVFLVCISANEKVFFSSIKTFILKEHQIETLALVETKEDELKKRIEELN